MAGSRPDTADPLPAGGRRTARSGPYDGLLGMLRGRPTALHILGDSGNSRPVSVS